MTKKVISNEAFDTAAELTQKTALVTLKSAVQAAEVTEGYVQGMYKAGYDANTEVLKIAEGYWDATSQIRQDWIKLFAATGENLINAAAKMEFPLQNLMSNVEKTVENLSTQAKTAGK
jgi:hypothetical protein